MEPDPLADIVVRCECGGREQIGERFHFRLHDHACPDMPADMANIPDEVARNGRVIDLHEETGDNE